MTQLHDTLKFELLKTNDHAKYEIHSTLEIRQLLRGLIAKRAMMTAYIGDSDRSFLTAILGLSPNESSLALDLSNDEEMNRSAEAAANLVCITQLDNIKIQFMVSAPRRMLFEGRQGLISPIPQMVIRLQRREYFRLAAPAAHALNCVIPSVDPAGQTTSYTARILDISGGGIAIVVPPKGVAFEPDQMFPDCRLTLPEFGAVSVNLKVRNLFRLTNRQGIAMLRAGCEFVETPDSVAALISRYILKVERGRGGRWRNL
ncbi:MAG: flagellar brake protein [Zoogloeaceae bacterium]|nr:flagellar brake protein [Zoogloeaceae bacterium]